MGALDDLRTGVQRAPESECAFPLVMGALTGDVTAFVASVAASAFPHGVDTNKYWHIKPTIAPHVTLAPNLVLDGCPGETLKQKRDWAQERIGAYVDNEFAGHGGELLVTGIEVWEPPTTYEGEPYRCIVAKFKDEAGKDPEWIRAMYAALAHIFPRYSQYGCDLHCTLLYCRPECAAGIVQQLKTMIGNFSFHFDHLKLSVKALDVAPVTDM